MFKPSTCPENPDRYNIDHVLNSGVRNAIKLEKLWNLRLALDVKTFILELLVIKILSDDQGESLDTQLIRVWETLQERASTISVEDPANPGGNDLSDLFDDATRSQLEIVAADTLIRITTMGWEAVFGPVEDVSKQGKAGALRGVAAAVASSRPTRPYFEHASSLV